MASKRRKSSFNDLISRLHPANRQERGHTLRPTTASDQISPSRVQPAHDSPSTNDDDTPVAVSLGRRRLSKILGSVRSGTPSTIKVGHRAEHTSESIDSQASTVVQQAQSTRSKVLGSMKSRASSTSSIGYRVECTAESAHIQPLQRTRSILLGLVKSKASSTDIRHRAGYTAENARLQASPVQQPACETEAVVDDKEITAEQKINNLKTAHKQHRRSLRASGDFLGVRGANPRTGRYDVSEGTTSTELSRFSDDYKRKIECEKLRQDAPKPLSPGMQESLTEVLRKAELEKAQKKQEERTERNRRVAEREARNQQRVIKWTPDKDSWNKSPLSPIPQSPTRSAESFTRRQSLSYFWKSHS
jgi:hypothetical protein